MNVFQFFHLQKDKQRKQRHSLKLGKKRRESSERNYYIISPRVIIKPIIIIIEMSRPKLICYYGCVFCSTPSLFVYLRMPVSTSKQICMSKQHSWVRGPFQECRSIRSGASGLPYYCAPLVCVSDWCWGNWVASCVAGYRMWKAKIRSVQTFSYWN